MRYTVEKVDIWKGIISDKPGELGRTLALLSVADANIEFCFARPVGKKSAMAIGSACVVYLAIATKEASKVQRIVKKMRMRGVGAF